MTGLALLAIMVLADDKDFVGPPAPPPDQPALRAMADDPHTLRLRIDNNMKAVEELLRRREVARSRELQDDILADLDKLLQRLQSPPTSNPDAPPPAGPPPTNEPRPDERPEPGDGQGPSGGWRSGSAPQTTKPQPGGGSAGREKTPNEQQPGAAPQSGGTRRERRGQKSRPQTNDRSADQSKPAPSNANPRSDASSNRPGPKPGDADGAPGANPDQARGATMSPSNAGSPERLSDMTRDVWGHLPDSLRQEVDHYYRERFMPRYRELLQQYYNRLSETDRRPKDKK